MAATLSSTGTWSTLAAAERPVQHHSTVEQRHEIETQVYEDAIKTNVGGFPELEQFLALAGQAYSIPGRAAAVHFHNLLGIMLNRTRTPSERSYTP